VYQAVPGAAGNGKERDLTDFHTKPLAKVTWPDFARLAEKHNGVWSGCWCMGFHLDGGWGKRTAAQNRSEKEQRVMDGNAHAALVYDGAIPIGWCQFGPTAELPRIKNRRAYEAGLTDLPDWRITCFFVDRDRRHEGVAAAGLRGALGEIARLGGGTVESYPEDVEHRKVSGSFMHNGTVAMFEREGFTRSRRLGKNHWVVTKTVPKSA
jgi:GNAT superfamily N-acetyltransferase